jgi:hypothetical protein
LEIGGKGGILKNEILPTPAYMKKFFFPGILVLMWACNHNRSTSTATDSTATTPDSISKTNMPNITNAQYLGYPNEGEILNADSVMIAIDELKALSATDRKARLKALKQANKDCLKGKIIKKPGTFRFALKGVDFFVNDQKIVGIGSLDLSQDVLNAITERLAMLDDLLYQTCVNLNREFNQKPQSDTRIMHLYDIQASATEELAKVGTTLGNLNQSNPNTTKIKTTVESLNKSVDSTIKKAKK